MIFLCSTRKCSDNISSDTVICPYLPLEYLVKYLIFFFTDLVDILWRGTMVTKRNITPGVKWRPGKTKKLILDPNNKAIRYEPTKKGAKFKSMNEIFFFI